MVTHGCLSGCVCKKDVGANSEELNVNISSFRFPLKKPELCAQWERFVNRRDWKPSANSVLYELHFEEKYVIRGKKCNRHQKFLGKHQKNACIKRISLKRFFTMI